MLHASASDALGSSLAVLAPRGQPGISLKFKNRVTQPAEMNKSTIDMEGQSLPMQCIAILSDTVPVGKPMMP